LTKWIRCRATHSGVVSPKKLSAICLTARRCRSSSEKGDTAVAMSDTTHHRGDDQMPKIATTTVPPKPPMKKLVIVESPAKAKTIGKILGDDYIVEASYGHVRDLPEGAKDVPEDLRDQE